MKKGFLVAILVSLAMVLAALPVFSQTAKTSTPSGNPIKIGGSLPLTGLNSEQAKWVKAGYESWAEDVNKAGGLLGRPVKLIIYDDEGNPDKAMTYYDRAITVDEVDPISGGCPGISVVAVMPLAEKYERRVSIGFTD